jgi:hypothetical protein
LKEDPVLSFFHQEQFLVFPFAFAAQEKKDMVCGVESREGEARRWIYRLSLHLHQEYSQSCFGVVFESGQLPEMSRVVGENRVVLNDDVEDNAKSGWLANGAPGSAIKAAMGSRRRRSRFASPFSQNSTEACWCLREGARLSERFTSFSPVIMFTSHSKAACPWIGSRPARQKACAAQPHRLRVTAHRGVALADPENLSDSEAGGCCFC